MLVWLVLFCVILISAVFAFYLGKMPPKLNHFFRGDKLNVKQAVVIVLVSLSTMVVFLSYYVCILLLLEKMQIMSGLSENVQGIYAMGLMVVMGVIASKSVKKHEEDIRNTNLR